MVCEVDGKPTVVPADVKMQWMKPGETEWSTDADNIITHNEIVEGAIYMCKYGDKLSGIVHVIAGT